MKNNRRNSVNVGGCCFAFLLFALPTIGNAAQEVFVAEITSASPSSFTAGQSATVTVRIRSTSGSGNVIIEADSWTSGWSVSPKNRNPTINQGTYYDQTFTVTPPTAGGSGTIVWKLYDDDYGVHPSGSKLLATRSQPVSAMAVTALSFRNSSGSIVNQIEAGQTVYLRADATGGNGQTITIELWEDDGLGDDQIITPSITINSSGYGTYPWPSVWQQNDGDTPINSYYLYYRPTALYSGAKDTGHFLVKDTTPPTIPTSYTSDPSANVWTNDNTVYVSWSGASDNASGIDGYSLLWNNSSSTIPDATKDTSSTSTTSSALSDGSWYLHIRVVDKVGNWSSGAFHCGPFKIDRTAPGKPTQQSPSNGGSVSTLRPTLTWSEASDGSGSGVSKYHLKVFQNWGVYWDKVDKDVQGTSYTLNESEALEWGKNYGWRVYAIDNVGNKGDYTNNWYFTVVESCTLSGTVTNSRTGEAISGASVSISGPTNKSITTGDGGDYSFTDIPAGAYTLSVSKTGYQTYSGSVNVSGNTTKNVSLTPYVTISTFGVTPNLIHPGGRLTVTYNLSNSSGSSQTVWLGASVKHSGTTTWLDDPDNDKVVSVPGGANSYQVQRYFDIGTGYTTGDYDIRVSPWQSKQAGQMVERYDLKEQNNAFPVAWSSLSGTVRDIASSRLISGASVSISGPVNKSTTTDGGTYSFSNIPGGTYTLSVSKEGYQPYSGLVNVSGNTTKDVLLTPEIIKPTVSIVASDPDAGEPANNGYFTVSRTGSTTGSLRVYYGTTGSTAIAGSDYADLPGYVDIPSGQASALISVVVINDSSVEGPETVKVTISSNTAYDIDPSKSYATVTIVDDPRIFSFLSGIVFDDLDHDSDIDSGEEVAGAVVSCQGRSATTGTMTERDGEYIISGLTPTSGDGLVDVEARINDTLYGGLCIRLEEGSNVCDIPIYKPEIDSANECGNAWTSCGIGFLGLIPFVGTYWDIKSTSIATCTANYRFNEGDPIGGIIAEIKAAMSAWHAIVNILDYLDGGTGQAADALPVTLKCLESLFWEYLNDQCKGYTSCLWDTLRDGALTPLLPLLAVFTGSPVDIRISDLQGNILQLAGDGFPLNNLPSIGWISRSPNDKELALVFSAEGTYIVEIIGRPEAGTGSTLNLQIMRQSADGTQGLFIYSDVPIAAGGIATAIAGEELEPVLQVDVDGDGTIDNYISPMVPVDDLVKIYIDESGYDHGTNQLSVDVTVINASMTYIGVPLQIVIQSISEPNVTMSDVNSTSQDAKNYVDLSELLLDDRQLEPSESITKRIYFYDPNGLRFTFEPSVRGVILEQPSSGPLLDQLSGLSRHWLDREASLDVVPAGGDGVINFRDFALIAEGWLNKE